MARCGALTQPALPDTGQELIDCGRINEGVESKLGALPAHWVTQNLGRPLETQADIGADLGVIDELLDHPDSLRRVSHSQEPPEVAEVLVPNRAPARLPEPFADLGALGQNQRQDLRDVETIRADLLRLGTTRLMAP